MGSTGLTLIGLGGPAARPGTAAAAEPESPDEAASSRISYSRFLDYLDQDSVKKVDFFENGTVAIAEVFNPTLNKIQRVKVQIPPFSQQLLRKLEEKSVDFAAHPVETNAAAAVLDLLSNLAFPLILLGSLLLSSSSSSPNSPRGPGFPFGLGRYLQWNKLHFNLQPSNR